MAEPPGRVLALDLGDARIGVALSDPERRLSLPAGTIKVAGGVEDLKAVARLVADTGAVEVVVGHPLALSGERGAAARQAEEFAGGLRAMLHLPVHLQDERLTTVEADRTLRAAGVGGRDRRRAIDQTAATLILEAFLSSAGT
ncbi:MAG: Holliday junction resolvase RuvX [Actinomycetota bacterium]|nr:Holliday junction resolvase RuvX [Actinomycetota bacterium]